MDIGYFPEADDGEERLRHVPDHGATVYIKVEGKLYRWAAPGCRRAW
jgi:hypothetical protein